MTAPLASLLFVTAPGPSLSAITSRFFILGAVTASFASWAVPTDPSVRPLPCGVANVYSSALAPLVRTCPEDAFSSWSCNRLPASTPSRTSAWSLDAVIWSLAMLSSCIVPSLISVFVTESKASWSLPIPPSGMVIGLVLAPVPVTGAEVCTVLSGEFTNIRLEPSAATARS